MAKNRAEATNSNNTNQGTASILTAFAVLALLGAGLALLLGLGSKIGEDRHFTLINSAILLGVAVGAFAAARRWFSDGTISTKFDGALVGYTATATVVIGALIYWCGMRQIGGYDQGPLIDIGYRMINGQTPYIDFPCTVPVAFFLGSKYAFATFGLEWRSLVLITIVYSAITFWWSVYLLNNLFGNRKLALLMAATLQAMALIDVAYWWYNPITAIAATVLVFSSVNWVYNPRSIAATTSQFFAVLLMAGMKPNVAGILVPFVTLVLLFVKPLRIRVLAVSIGAFVVFVGILAVNHLSLSAMVKSYLAVSERGFSLKQFLQDMGPNEKALSLTAFGLIVAPAFARLRQMKEALRSPVTWIAVVGYLAGLYGFITDGESKIVDLPLLLASSIVLGARLNPAPREGEPSVRFAPTWNRYFTFICIALMFAGLGQAVMRHRVRAIGPMAFFEYGGTTEKTQDGFFKDVRSGPLLIEVNKEIADVLQKNPNASIFFGPRMEWGYANFHKPSPKNLPVWWHPGVSYGMKDENTYIQRFFEDKFDIIILKKNDVANMPYLMVQGIVERYGADQSYPWLTVLHLRK